MKKAFISIFIFVMVLVLMSAGFNVFNVRKSNNDGVAYFDTIRAYSVVLENGGAISGSDSIDVSVGVIDLVISDTITTDSIDAGYTITDYVNVGTGTTIKKMVVIGNWMAVITSSDDTFWFKTDTL